jgi:hypothetical protein
MTKRLTQVQSRDDTQHLAETSIDKDSKTGSEPPAACQSNSQNIESPSAVDNRPSGEETTQSSPQPQQDRHVQSSTQVSSDSQSVSNSQQHHNAAQEPAQQSESHRPSCRVITNWWDVDDDEIKRHQAVSLPQCTVPVRSQPRQPHTRDRSKALSNPATKPSPSQHRGPSPRDG